MRVSLLLVCLVLAIGCSSTSSPDLIHLGGGNALSTKIVDKTAKEQGITRAEATEKLRASTAKRRIKEHCDRYGVSENQAREQLAYADEHHSTPYMTRSNQQAAESIDKR